MKDSRVRTRLERSRNVISQRSPRSRWSHDISTKPSPTPMNSSHRQHSVYVQSCRIGCTCSLWRRSLESHVATPVLVQPLRQPRLPQGTRADSEPAEMRRCALCMAPTVIFSDYGQARARLSCRSGALSRSDADSIGSSVRYV